MTDNESNELFNEWREFMNAQHALGELAQITPDTLTDEGASNGLLLEMVSDRVSSASIAYMTKAEGVIDKLETALKASQGAT